MFENIRLIDLSVPLSHQSKSEPFPAEIEYLDHEQGGKQMTSLFGIDKEQLEFSDEVAGQSRRLTRSPTLVPMSMQPIIMALIPMASRHER